MPRHSQSSTRRRFIVAACGVLLLVLAWFFWQYGVGQELTPESSVKSLGAEPQSQQTALLKEQPSAAVVAVEPVTMTENKALLDVADDVLVDDKEVASAPVAATSEVPVVENTQSVALEEKPKIVPRAPSIAIEKVPAAALPVAPKVENMQTVPLVSKPKAAPETTSVAMVKLLSLNLQEVGVTARVMVEFEQLPKYRWNYLGTDKKLLSFHFSQAKQRIALPIPEVAGPLLKALRLQAEGRALQLQLTANSEFKVEILELPADPFHGPRLLIELIQPRQKLAVNPQPKPRNDKLLTTQVEPQTAKTVKIQTGQVSKQRSALTPEQQAEQVYGRALQQLANNETLAAETSLANALALQPNLLEARLQLLALLQDSSREKESEKYLLGGLRLHPENPELRKKYARLLMNDGLLTGAIGILQSEPQPEIASDLEYHALQAALQQQLEQHPTAVKSYQQLLSYRPQESFWWLGLAISLEQSGRKLEAKEAYQKAIALPGLRPDLRDYASSRLQDL